MTNITLNPPPGFYASGQTVSVQYSNLVSSIQYAINNPAADFAKTPVAIADSADSSVIDNVSGIIRRDGQGSLVLFGDHERFQSYYTMGDGNFAPTDDDILIWHSDFLGANLPSNSNLFCYVDYWTGSLDINVGDKLVFDIYCTGPYKRMGFDFVGVKNGSSFTGRDYPLTTDRRIVDQNGVMLHPAAGELDTLADNRWYHREFDLTPAAPFTMTTIRLANESDMDGRDLQGRKVGDHLFQAYIRNAYILDSAGNVKLEIFGPNTMDTRPELVNNDVGGSYYDTVDPTLIVKYKSSSDTMGYSYWGYRAWSRKRGVGFLNPKAVMLERMIREILSPSRMNAGKKKFLVIGDNGVSPGFYPTALGYVKRPSGYYGIVRMISARIGVEVDFIDPNDYNGTTLDPTPALLDQYLGVVLVSSQGGTVPYITISGAQALIDFYKGGGGLLVLTSFGADIPDISSANSPSSNSDFVTANGVLSPLGIYFTGKVQPADFTNRATYTDPILEGLSDPLFILSFTSTFYYAKVVFTNQGTPVANLTQLTIPSDPQTTINIKALLSDGTTETYSFVYNVFTGQLVRVYDTVGVEIQWFDINTVMTTPPLGTSQTQGDYINFVPQITGLGSVPASGQILKNGVPIANLKYSEATGTVTEWLAGSPKNIRVVAGDKIVLRITNPLTYEIVYTITRPSAPGNQTSLAKYVTISSNRYRDYRRSVKGLVEMGYPEVGGVRPDPASNLRLLNRFYNNTLELPTIDLYVFSTTTDVNNFKGQANAPAPLVVQASTGVVSVRREGVWSDLAGVKLKDLVGAPRKVRNPQTGLYYRLNTDGSISTV